MFTPAVCLSWTHQRFLPPIALLDNFEEEEDNNTVDKYDNARVKDCCNNYGHVPQHEGRILRTRNTI
jgi:hypothetical protein